MTEYIVLIPGDETEWAKAAEPSALRVYGTHQEFAKALAERGHKVTGGAELAHSTEANDRERDGARQRHRRARTPRPSSSSPASTRPDRDLDDLLECVGILAEGESELEVRRCLEMEAGARFLVLLSEDDPSAWDDAPRRERAGRARRARRLRPGRPANAAERSWPVRRWPRRSRGTVRRGTAR